MNSNNEQCIKTIKQAMEIFAPLFIEIKDDSAAHSTHAGAKEGGHFILTIVSEQFENINRVSRQKMINKEISNLFSNGIHALVIVAKTPKEFYH